MLTSDHVPLILTCSQQGPTRNIKRLERYRFQYEDFNCITAHVFAPTDHTPGTDPIYSFADRINTLHTSLRTWHSCKFAQSPNHLQNCKCLLIFFDQLEERRTLTPLELFIQTKVKEKAYELATNDEIRWHQRTRSKWLAARDRNTKYFYALASSKSTIKAVTMIVDLDRQLSGTNYITDAFFSNYKALMGTTYPTKLLDISTLYQLQYQQDLLHLDSPFESSEVHRAVT